MSKQITENVQFAAGASSLATRMMGGVKLTLTAFSFYSLAISAFAQSPAAPERGFTLSPDIETQIVLRTQPDAACDLHPAGVADPAHSMRLFADAEGYVRFHARPKQNGQEARVQLDCGAAVYPLHLRSSASPTADMPAPLTSVPIPKGAKVLPALTEEAAQQLSDNEVLGQGYPPRPDAAASPDNYAKWLDLVSRPITLLPSHPVSRSNISHGPGSIQAGIELLPNWSGFEARGSAGSYMSVQGEWNVPPIAISEPGFSTSSATWVGLDGDITNFGPRDLVQAGTEQDNFDFGFGYFSGYYAWTELLPNQPTEQPVNLPVNAGDDIFVSVWIGDSGGFLDVNGPYAFFYLYNKTQHQAVKVQTPLGSTFFSGSEAEWIMERPCQCTASTAIYTELSAYVTAVMSNAYVLPAKGSWIPAGTAANIQLTMYENNNPQPDNNLLSNALKLAPTVVQFFWHNFH
jgi:hypothetical protein